MITHRLHTPIIMLLASDCEMEAYRAGADAFLKHEDISIVVETNNTCGSSDMQQNFH